MIEVENLNGKEEVQSKTIGKIYKDKLFSSIINYSSDGTVFSKTIYKYDVNDNLTSKVIYDSEGKVTTDEEYLYDENNFQIGKIIYKHEEEFGEKVRKVETKVYWEREFFNDIQFND